MISIGYMGVEAFDIILYMAKTLSTLDYPVLIVDLSDTGALTETIYHGMDLDSEKSIIHYRDINYTRKAPQENELDDFKDGVVFVVYGFNNISWHSVRLDYLNIILDSFPYKINKVNKILSNIRTDDIKVRLLVRDIITMDDFDRVQTTIISRVNPVSASYIYYDMNDYINAIKCQASQVIRFKGISSSMREYIRSEIDDMFPSTKPSHIRKAICIAGKGEKYR